MKNESEYNLTINFIYECSLLLDYIKVRGWFLSIVDSLNNEYKYFLEVRKTDFLSEKSIVLYKVFHCVFTEYLKNVAYSENEDFIYLDSTWYRIRLDYLIPFIASAEEDIISLKKEYVTILNNFNVDNKPSDENILSSATFLYQRLKEKK